MDERPASIERGGAGRRKLCSKHGSTTKSLVLAAAGAGLILVTATVCWRPPLLFVWNASPSVPVGLYLLTGGPARKGDMVVALMPRAIRRLAARRHYLPPSVPLVKHVAAAGGDRLCASGARILVNGVDVAVRLRADPAGRAMPWWSGCRILGSREFFLLAHAPLSFDGRYFGVSRTNDLLGRAELLWAA